MKTFYVTLIGPLLGSYIAVKAKDERAVSILLNNGRLKRLWCSVYTSKEEMGVERHDLVEAKCHQSAICDDSYHASEDYRNICGKELF